MPNTPQDTTVPRETMVKVAKGYHELNALHRQMQRTQALMIRACLERIVATPSGHKWGAEAMAEQRVIRVNRQEALDGLAELATMLERQGAEPLDKAGEPVTIKE